MSQTDVTRPSSDTDPQDDLEDLGHDPHNVPDIPCPSPDDTKHHDEAIQDPMHPAYKPPWERRPRQDEPEDPFDSPYEARKYEDVIRVMVPLPVALPRKSPVWDDHPLWNGPVAFAKSKAPWFAQSHVADTVEYQTSFGSSVLGHPLLFFKEFAWEDDSGKRRMSRADLLLAFDILVQRFEAIAFWRQRLYVARTSYNICREWESRATWELCVQAEELERKLDPYILRRYRLASYMGLYLDRLAHFEANGTVPTPWIKHEGAIDFLNIDNSPEVQDAKIIYSDTTVSDVVFRVAHALSQGFDFPPEPEVDDLVVEVRDHHSAMWARVGRDDPPGELVKQIESDKVNPGQWWPSTLAAYDTERL